MDYVSEKWQEILSFNDLDTAQKIWDLEADWFEEPNSRRGGWSGVSRIELKLPQGGTVMVFLKRQENHITRTISSPIKGIATFAKEFAMISSFTKRGIATLDVISFCQLKTQGQQRACLMTEELADYLPLSSDEYKTGGAFFSSEQQKKGLFKEIISLMELMHQHKFQHDCFYPKHVFVKQLAGGGVDLRVIDLEKVKRKLTVKATIFRDLETFIRHSDGWSDEDKMSFFKAHQNEETLSKRSEKLWQRIADRVKVKSH